MELILEIVSYHRLSPEQNSKISIHNTLSFGRSKTNGWHLPDPEKVVSGSHARIEKLADGFYIYDLSTNGLYINRAVEALGQTHSHKLSQGDLLTFGDYEVSVTLLSKAATKLGTSPPPATAVTERIANTVPTEGISPSALFGDVPLKPNTPIVTNDLNDHFDVPQAIPAEWDANFLGHNTIAASLAETIENPTVKQEIKTPTASPLHHVGNFPIQPTRKVPVPSTSSSVVNTGINSFIKGLGISKSIMPEHFSDELLYEMGQGMQQMLMGLVESLRTRTALKNEFRINQTTFQQQENNPLKFSATIDDVFQNLFLKRSASFLPSTEAITEAFNDVIKHDVALTAGTLGAIKGIFSQLDPIEIEKKDLKNSVFDQVIPGQKQLRYWRIYQNLHQDLVSEIMTHGSSALSDDFVRSYDKKINSL